MNEEQNTRLECLHMACHACGEYVPFQIVLEYAEEYYNFVMGEKKSAIVVPFKQADLPDGVS